MTILELMPLLDELNRAEKLIGNLHRITPIY